MVRHGFDRVDLCDMPFTELIQWHNTLMDQLQAEADVRKKAQKK